MTTPDRQLYRLRDVQYIPIGFRNENNNDVNLTFDWANDPLARQMSFNQKPSTWEEHWRWVHDRAVEGNWWILEEFNGYGDVVPIGQVRFDKRVGVLGMSLSPFIREFSSNSTMYEHFIASIFLAEEFRGKGHAMMLLRLGLARIESQQPKLPCIAYIKKENASSIRLFRRMYFAKTFNIKGSDYTAIDGDDYVTLIRYWE